MKTTIKRTIGAGITAGVLLAMMGWMSPVNYYNIAIENDFIRSVKKKLFTYDEQIPEERIYLQMDKTLYGPGENIWFNVFIRNGKDLKPSAKSDIVHVELINPKGGVEKSLKLIAENGVAAGDFFLDETAVGGLYTVKAYTNWMKNDGENNVFEKELQVQNIILPRLKMKLNFERKAFGVGDEVIAKLELNTNENKPLSNYNVKFIANLNGQKLLEQAGVTDEEGLKYIRFSLPEKLTSSDGLLNVMIDYEGSTESISRSIPIVLNKIKLNVYPEGGDLVYGLESKVAFRTLNEFGKPADVEGIVMTEKGSRVASFSSFHQGMGAFKIIPQPGEKYKLKILKPEGILETFELPEALSRGYIMNVDPSKQGEVTVTINTTETEELSLIAQVRGKIYYSTAVNVVEGNNKLTFSTKKFPIGVAQLTLFDSEAVPRAERLLFVNKNKQLSIDVKTDKEKYLPREKVKMTISVKDDRGLPMPANLSMAVVNDQLLSFADDKSGNILSQLLLEQDIKDKIEEPSFYFNVKEPKADEALDYLLMTSGWRRYTWEKVMSEDLPAIAYQGERAIIKGLVMDYYKGKPLANATVKASNGMTVQTDSVGQFIMRNLKLYDPIMLSYSAPGYSQRTQYAYDYQEMYLYLYSREYYGNNKRKSTVKFDLAEDAIPMAAPEEMVVKVASAAGEGLRNFPSKSDNAGGKLQENAKPEAIIDRERRGAELAEVIIADKRFEAHNKAHLSGKIAQQATVYYLAKQFAAPVYDKQENVEVRTDFRNTIYWNADVEVDRSGKKIIEFYASDDITSFRTTVEGISSSGAIGRNEKTFFTQLPFAMSTKIPVEVATEDLVSIPVTLKNNTTAPLGGAFTVTAPDGLKLLSAIANVQTIMPGKAKTIYLDYKVLNRQGNGDFTVMFKACGLSDAFTQKIKMVSKGFPVNASMSGQEIEKEFSIDMQHMVKGSVKAMFTAYPNVVSDLMKGVEGILREPSGCFEQTSTSAYPNAMVLDYLKSTDSKDDKTLARADALLDKGYKRLLTFETKEKGYEWFGAAPGHEGLSAYGLMEFVDMKKAGGDVDQKMIDRTAEWIMSHRDGKGGFARKQYALHDFGRISDDILNAYIVYALAEAGYVDIKKEFESSFKKAMELKDPYMLAMMANAAYKLNETKKAEEAMNLLLSKQEKEGSWTGASHSITYSQGKSLTIESTALGIMAMLKSPSRHAEALNKAVQYIVASRSGSGVFSSTQGTILALKALTEYAKFSKKTTEDGTVNIYVDGKKVAEKYYKAGENEPLIIEGLEAYLKEGKHTIKVKYTGVKNPLPYSVAVNWNTTLPTSSVECAIELKTKLAAKSANVGETVRLSATIKNSRNEGIPSTMAIIGIPAGLTVQPWQLKELQERKMFDYYEILGNNIAFYYRGMGPNDVKEIHLDLKAEIPGKYDAPASSAYLYYTNEFKCWTAVDKITIKKPVL